MQSTARWMMILTISLTLVAPAAMAADVFLNGVKITGKRGVEFGKVEVKLDASGNVHITAPDIVVQEVGDAAAKPKDPTPPPAAPSDLTKGYFIITEGSEPGATGYDVKLMVNNKFIKTMADTIPQHVVELNEYLKKGANTVSFQALRVGRKAKGSGEAASFTVLIGVGSAKGGQLAIEEVLHEFKVTAADLGEKAKTFPLVAK